MKLWSLFNIETKEQYNGLTEFEIRNKIKTNKIKDLEILFVWSDHLSDWKKITEVPEFNKNLIEQLAPKKNIPPPPPMGDNSGSKTSLSIIEQKTQAPNSIRANNDSESIVKSIERKEVNSLQKKKIEFPELRKHPRYSIKLKVLFRTDTIAFRTFTTNISLGGVALQNSIPEVLLNQKCELILTSQNLKENIKFNVHILDHGTITRLKFINGDKAVERLKKWIERHIQYNTKNRKGA